MLTDYCISLNIEDFAIGRFLLKLLLNFDDIKIIFRDFRIFFSQRCFFLGSIVCKRDLLLVSIRCQDIS